MGQIRQGMAPKDFLITAYPLNVKNLIYLRSPNNGVTLPAVGVTSGIAKFIVTSSPALCAGSMSSRERGCFIKKEQLGVCVGRH